MKRKSANIIWIIVVILAIVAVIGFYIYDVAYQKNSPTKNLFRALAIVVLLLGTLFKLVNGGNRKSLGVYEKIYEQQLGYAFKDKPFARKKLLCAVRLYNENNYRKALKYLFQLIKEAKTERDIVPVLLFIALCYTDGGAPEEAIKVYYDLLKHDYGNSTAHNNLGQLYIQKGKFDMALQHYSKAIECNPNNPAAYNNRANYYFRIKEYDEAIVDAKKALEIKNNMVQAASLLAVIYALKNDSENKKKYYHIAITSGRSPEELDESIEYFMREEAQEDNEEAE